MGILEARTHLESLNLDIEIMEFDQSSATVDLAAQALGVDPDRIAKTMAFMLKDRPILIITSGKARIDNRKFKDQFSQKARMVPPDELVTITGHPMGGVCPFGLVAPLDIYLDESLRQYDTVYPACGTVNSAVRIRVADLAQVTDGIWIHITG
jgi:prolyl-tRNA editing enzyme YbaK/EbsC (Cys-tRNA(Pro) deacylase)